MKQLPIINLLRVLFSYMRNPGGATIDGSEYKNNALFNKEFLVWIQN